MHVTKRDGSREPVRLDAISDRLRGLCGGSPAGRHPPHLEPHFAALDGVDVARIATKVCQFVHDGVDTYELDTLAAGIAGHLTTDHPDYGLLAARILVSDFHKRTPESALEAWATVPNIDPRLPDLVSKNPEIQGWLDFSLDYVYDTFALKTWRQMYLLGDERPQHAFLRVALGIWGDDLGNARKTYELLSTKRMTHASPTLFNCGTKVPQCASCFLTGVWDDSIDGIFGAYHQIAKISKFGGGIGMHIHKVRGKGARIRTTNGKSDGIVPMARVFNEVIRYINQSGRRLGSLALYLEPTHPDILDFLDLRRNQGDEHLRARDLFYAVWIPDRFMRAVEADADWHLFDPSDCPGLDDAWGDEYDRLVDGCIADDKAVRVVKARDIWNAVLRSQVETGTPYLLYKDAVNAKSNQQHLGTIKSSNLCTEIVEFTAPDEIAVCTLGSVCLPAFVSGGDLDFAGLHRVTKQLAKNLDRVIDVTYYPVEDARRSNARHRPVGIGVQGLQDVFFDLKMPFESREARALNERIFACMYHAAIEASVDLAAEHGPHPSYPGSPASRGLLQFDLWNADPDPAWDWAALKARMAAHGLRNGLSLAPMPTASTAQLMGNTEAFEPLTSNMYVRKTLVGDFVVVNSRLQRDLIRRGLWTPAVKNSLVAAEGRLTAVPGVPEDLMRLYKPAWDMSMKALIDMAVDRGKYVCQSQSLNLFVDQATTKKLSSMHFYAWRSGLKTGVYYLRTRPATSPVKITVTDHRQVAAPEPCVQCSG